MDIAELKRFIETNFEGVTSVESSGDTFFTYDPHGALPAQGWQPFATLVTGDHYDDVSALAESGCYRLNIGLPKAAYLARFGAAPTERDERGVLRTGFDYAIRDQLLPHPHYASQYWVCVISPSARTFEAVVRPLLAQSYDFAARKHANRDARRAGEQPRGG